jgi:hypothetical protein
MSHENVIEHPELKRAKAFALYLARCHARNNGLPLPDPESFQPLGFTKLTPGMSRDEKVERLTASLKRYGVEVNPIPKTERRIDD